MMHGAFTAAGLLAQLGALLMIAAMISGRIRRVRLGLAISGLLWAIAAAMAGTWIAFGWALVIALVNAIHLFALWNADRKVVLSIEEATLHSTAFGALSLAQVRHLIDQGVWIEGQPGEVLTREGEPVTHLFFLAEGSARVLSGETEVGRCGTGSFVGEATVLSAEPATGTVVLDRPSRFWCVEADDLRRYLRDNPDIGSTIQGSFARSLKDKLAASNRAMAGKGGLG